MIIALDVDGVLADFTGKWLDILEDTTGIKLPKFRLTGSLDDSSVTPFLGDKDRETVWDRVCSPGFVSSLETMTSHTYIKNLRKQNKVLAVTSPMKRSPTWVYERTQWLAQNYSFKHDEIIHTSAKAFVDADILIDDMYKNCVSFSSRRNRVSFLWTQPENRNVTITSPGIHRVSTWETLLSNIADMNRGIVWSGCLKK